MSRVRLTQTPVEMLLGQIINNKTGYPVEIATARTIFGAHTCLAPQPGWFWIPATQASAQNIRENGHRVNGEEVNVWIPRQNEITFKATGIREVESLGLALGGPSNIMVQSSIGIGRNNSSRKRKPRPADQPAGGQNADNV